MYYAVFSRCQFIKGAPTKDAKMCGKPVQRGSSYCPAHYKKCIIESVTALSLLRKK